MTSRLVLARILVTVLGGGLASCRGDGGDSGGGDGGSTADDETTRGPTTRPADGDGTYGATSTSEGGGTTAPEGGDDGSESSAGRGSESGGGEAELCNGDSNSPMEFWFGDCDWPFELDNGQELRVIDAPCDVTPLDPMGDTERVQFDCEDPQGTPHSVIGFFNQMDQLVAGLAVSRTVALRVVHVGQSESPTWFSVRNPRSGELIGFGVQAEDLSLRPYTDGFSDPIDLAFSDSECRLESGYCGTFEKLVIDFDVSGRGLVLGDDMRVSFEGYDFNLGAAYEEDVTADDVPNCGSPGFRRAIGLFVTREP